VKKVLIVDDSETIRHQVAAALEGAGFSVIGAADGMEGLEHMAKNQLCLIIVDVNMPRLNGLEMLEKIRADPTHASTPVLMLTTEAHHAMIDRARKMGARGWMIKPIKSDQLLNAVTKLTS
jgi:two-component system chemotaxis response regulator CheY